MKEKEIKVSFKQVRVFRANAINYLERFAEETKLRYALEKMLKLTQNIEEKWQQFIKDTDREKALEDANGRVLFDTDTNTGERIFHFSKEGLKARDEIIGKEFAKPGTNAIEPFIASDLPKNLHADFIEVFTPFVIKKAS